MSRDVDARIDRLLRQSECRGRCFVADASFRRSMKRRAPGAYSPAPGVFVRRAYWDGLSPREKSIHLMRAFYTQRPRWVFSGVSAALAWGLYVSYSDIQENRIPLLHVAGRRRRVAYDGCIVQFSTFNPRAGGAPVVAGGMRVRALPDAIVESCCMLSFPAALGVADSATRFFGCTRNDLLSTLEGYRKRPGWRTTQRAFSHANGLSENGGESYARGVMIEEGFVEPMVQVPFFDPIDGRERRADYGWVNKDGVLIYGELDGLEKTSDARMLIGGDLNRTLRDERIRESRLTIGGAGVLRFTMDDVHDRARFRRILEAFGVPRAH